MTQRKNLREWKSLTEVLAFTLVLRLASCVWFVWRVVTGVDPCSAVTYFERSGARSPWGEARAG